MVTALQSFIEVAEALETFLTLLQTQQSKLSLYLHPYTQVLSQKARKRVDEDAELLEREEEISTTKDYWKWSGRERERLLKKSICLTILCSAVTTAITTDGSAHIYNVKFVNYYGCRISTLTHSHKANF